MHKHLNELLKGVSESIKIIDEEAANGNNQHNNASISARSNYLAAISIGYENHYNALDLRKTKGGK